MLGIGDDDHDGLADETDGHLRRGDIEVRRGDRTQVLVEHGEADAAPARVDAPRQSAGSPHTIRSAAGEKPSCAHDAAIAGPVGADQSRRSTATVSVPVSRYRSQTTATSPARQRGRAPRKDLTGLAELEGAWQVAVDPDRPVAIRRGGAGHDEGVTTRDNAGDVLQVELEPVGRADAENDDVPGREISGGDDDAVAPTAPSHTAPRCRTATSGTTGSQRSRRPKAAVGADRVGGIHIVRTEGGGDGRVGADDEQDHPSGARLVVGEGEE